MKIGRITFITLNIIKALLFMEALLCQTRFYVQKNGCYLLMSYSQLAIILLKIQCNWAGMGRPMAAHLCIFLGLWVLVNLAFGPSFKENLIFFVYMVRVWKKNLTFLFNLQLCKISRFSFNFSLHSHVILSLNWSGKS